MKRKVAAGILAFICTVNTFAINGTSFNGKNQLSSGIAITAVAESAGIPDHVSTIKEYYNNAYYTHELSEMTDEDSRWTVGSYTYGIVRYTVSHEEYDPEAEQDVSVTDLEECRVALVAVNAASRLTSVAPYTKVNVSSAAKTIVEEAEATITDSGYCTVIGDGVFEDGGQYLKEVDLTGIEIIGNRAFASCKYITVIDIPDSVVSMGNGVFADSGVKTVTMNNNITCIPDETFMNTPLSKITFANQDIICGIGESAFANTTLTSYPLVNSEQYVSIGINAFSECTQIAEFKMPDNVVAVYDSAFDGCTALKTLVTGKNCKVLGHSAFANCSSLTSITLNDGLMYLGAGAFSYCTALVNGPAMPDSISFRAIDIPAYEADEAALAELTTEYAGYTVYADGASSCEGIFEGCTALKKVYLPSTADTIPAGYCNGCTSLTSATFGENVINIYDDAFAGCVNLQDILLSNVQGYIGRNAFDGCAALKSLFSNTICVINDSAFSGCTSLKSFDITTLACMHNAFEGCTGLTDVGLRASTWGAYIFSDCTNLQSAYLALKGATSTPDGIFYNCEKLSDLKDTDFSTVQIISTDAFTNCKALKSLSLPSVVIVDSNAFSGCSSLTKICSGDITIQDYGDYSFYGCINLTQNVSSKASTIGRSAFEESGIKSLTIDSTVGNTLVIDNDAFKNCDKLQFAKINIADTSIEYEMGDNIFEDCDVMTTIEYSGTELPVGFVMNCGKLTSVNIPRVQDVMAEAFSGCTSLKEISGVETFKSIGDSAFYGCEALGNTYADKNTIYSGESQYMGCKSLTEATVYDITPSMFADCTALSKVNLSANISTIDTYAFKGCTNLETIDLSKVKYFEEGSFSESGIRSLALTSTNVIGDSAFSDCAKLSNIDIETDTIGNSAFSGCGMLSRANITANTIGDSAFSNCESLYMVNFPETSGYSLIDIGGSAFYGTMLSDVLVPSTVLNIGNRAFGYGSESVAFEDFTLYGTKGSAAEEYATDNGINFLDKSKYNSDSVIEKKYKPGDVNCDGVISVVDAVLLQRWLLCSPVSGIYGPNMDLTNDGRVDAFDLCLEKRLIIEQSADDEVVE